MSASDRSTRGDTLAALAISVAALAIVAWIASSGNPQRLTQPAQPAMHIHRR